MSLKDSGADPRMLFHLLEFFGSEAAGLLQDAFGDADFADIVQQAGHVGAFGEGIAEAGLQGQLPAQDGDALAVAAGVGVLGIHRAGQAVQQAHHQAVHVVEEHGVFEIDGRFVGDGVEELAVLRVEIAAGLVPGRRDSRGRFPARWSGTAMSCRTCLPSQLKFVSPARSLMSSGPLCLQSMGDQLFGEAMDAAGRQAERPVKDRFLALDVISAQGHAHSLHAHDFQNVQARLLEEIVRGAVDAHPAADLVDQAQFLVGVGQMAGEGIQLGFQASQAKLIFEHAQDQAGLSLHGFFGVSEQLLGLLAEPGAVESEAAANPQDFLGEVEILRPAG